MFSLSNEIYNKLIKNTVAFGSEKFKTPHSLHLLDNLVDRAISKVKTIHAIAEQARNTAPVIDQAVYDLMQSFLKQKQTSGNDIEKAVYAEQGKPCMTVPQFITRLLTKRPLTFYLSRDRYLLQNGTRGEGGFESIGTTLQVSPLLLKDTLSYEEMRFSALLNVCVPTYFINNGNRSNRGKPDGDHELFGFYWAMVGARFERPNQMEYSCMLVTEEQNRAENGYGDQKAFGFNHAKAAELELWARFYGSKLSDCSYGFPTYSEVEKQAQAGLQYHKLSGPRSRYLNIDIYKQRMRVIFRNFLLESNLRAFQAGQQAYLHIVGLGTGCWAVDTKFQEQCMIDVYVELINTHGESLSNIATLNFSWFTEGLILPNKVDDIELMFSNRNPADKVTEGHLLCAMYAWDSGSYPGNEYWVDQLSASGDPAAACCSTITQLQNPLINPFCNGDSLVVWDDKAQRSRPSLLPSEPASASASASAASVETLVDTPPPSVRGSFSSAGRRSLSSELPSESASASVSASASAHSVPPVPTLLPLSTSNLQAFGLPLNRPRSPSVTASADLPSLSAELLSSAAQPPSSNPAVKKLLSPEEVNLIIEGLFAGKLDSPVTLKTFNDSLVLILNKTDQHLKDAKAIVNALVTLGIVSSSGRNKGQAKYILGTQIQDREPNHYKIAFSQANLTQLTGCLDQRIKGQGKETRDGDGCKHDNKKKIASNLFKDDDYYCPNCFYFLKVSMGSVKQVCRRYTP